jgi:Delta3-Delta2-enoyl-CoA isomerase
MILSLNRGPVRELRLNRPPVNALSHDLITALLRAVEVAPEQGAEALVLSGPPGMFSAGLDIPMLIKLSRPSIATLWRDFYTLLRVLASSSIPIAAAITGHAPAGGTVLTLFCDWRVAAQGEWKIGLSEVQVGLVLPPVIYSALRRLVGSRHAERLAVNGLLMNPVEAASVGLVDEVVSPEKVIDRAVKWCQHLLAMPRVAREATRKQARADLVGLFEHDLEHEIRKVSECWWTEETQSALRNMVENLRRKKKQTR